VGEGPPQLRVVDDGAAWRWTYEGVEAGEQVRLTSSIAFASRDAALRAGRTAYPEAVLVAPQPEAGRRHRWLSAAVGAAFVALGRRRRRVTRAPVDGRRAGGR
jgi:hypothetical protein